MLPHPTVGTTPNPCLETTPSPDETNPGPTLRRRPSTKPPNSPAKGHSQKAWATVSGAPHPLGHRELAEQPCWYKTSRTGRRPRAHRQWRSRTAAGAPPPLTLPHLTPIGTPEGDTTWRQTSLTYRAL
ncbi:hypothetical protein AAFF_G00410060 [Aldrovandia affinis]|uniref:Uncharacterized protein n=1 Tax=Aldrovandia affinis TaxID=143900 RepID=A0AAD7SBP8_9TELE|nr:hypothetical protein AAFF_G00410060 [Aldrovandia affinis]